MALPDPVITEADVYAVRAVLAGNATPDQQRRCMNWIGTQCCHVFDSPYISQGGDRDTFVMIGRHQVGVMITGMTTEDALDRARAYDGKRSQAPALPRTHRKPRGRQT